ncbi:unnamed protein product, partial [Adineta steineri]
MKKHTRESVTKDYGKLLTGAPYARVALDTQMDIIQKLLFGIWQIKKPRLIMSIIGGAKYFVLTERVETNFINSIIDVALKSKALIFTNGFDVGLVQLVGKAIKKSKSIKINEKITAVGIAKWGSVKNLTQLKAGPKHSAQQTTNNGENTIQQSNGEGKIGRVRGEQNLEKNHSQYLLMDDGTIRNYDTGDFRTRLAKQISQIQSEGVLPIPVVTIVVEGGRDTITNMYYDLRENIPVVIIDGSGRVADFFKRWLLYTEEMDNKVHDPDYKQPIEINELNDKVPASVTNSTKSSTDENKDTSKTSGGATTSFINLDTQTEKLKNLFLKYFEKIEEELKAIVIPEEVDSSKDNTEKQSKQEEFQKQVADAAYRVLYCLQPAVRSDITVFNLNSDNDLSEAIFRGICKASQKQHRMALHDRVNTLKRYKNKSRPMLTDENIHHHSTSVSTKSKQEKTIQSTLLLELAMSWNSIDVAKELILQNSLENIHGENDLFIKALTKNRPNFVHEFIRIGVDPSEVFFPNDKFFSTNSKPNQNHSRYDFFIQKLYSTEAVNRPECLLASVIESDPDVKEKYIKETETLNDVLRTLIGDNLHLLYFDTHDDELNHRKMSGFTTNFVRFNQMTDGKNAQSLRRANREMAQDYIMRDLFLWAILMNYIDMAKVFLAHMKYRICAALIATKILKNYSRRVPYDEIKKNYIENISYFENYAINCIDLCQKNNSEDACEIVLRQIELFGNISCLQIAANADNKLFLAHSCCVQALNNIWYDKLYPDQSKKRNRAALFIGFLSFGLLAPVFVEYRKEPKKAKHKDPKAQLESHAINYCDPYPLEHPRITTHVGFSRYCHQLNNFHASVLAKYTYHWVQYCFFLLLFSYTLLFKFEPPTNNTPSIYWTEILTIILVSCMLIEEIHF